MCIRVLLGTAFFACFLSVQEAAATPVIATPDSTLGAALTETQKVERLIEYIRELKGATFIRNGIEHSCEEAANHLLGKWQKHSSKLSTAEDFVQKLASESGMTGIDYKIRFADGTIVTTKQVLLEELKRIEQQ